MKRVVSFSLWGSKEVYLQGALDAVDQVHAYYPGWEPWFYLRADVPESTRRKLKQRGACLHDGQEWGAWAGMFWRFFAASDPSVEIMLSRDVDTVILDREVKAVNEWIDSGKVLHIMRDHPKHEMPIMGGMWGCRANAFRDIADLIARWNRFDRYGCDQEFLARVIYPKFMRDAWIHSECVHFSNERIRSFPTKRDGDLFIGMALREESLVAMHARYLKEWVEAGCPTLLRPHPWSILGRIRRLTRGLWPGENI